MEQVPVVDRRHVRGELVAEGRSLSTRTDQEGPRWGHDHGHLTPGLQRRHHSVEKGKTKMTKPFFLILLPVANYSFFLDNVALLCL